MLSLPRAQVQSLVGELRSHKLHGEAKKKKEGAFLIVQTRIGACTVYSQRTLNFSFAGLIFVTRYFLV